MSRDCSVQRRFQKVIELAPAPGLDQGLREQLCAEAVGYARHIDYRNAGTVEFLVDQAGRHAFIEMNPRIQVEHTVTEEVTDVDLVENQFRIAGGQTLAEIGLSQDMIRTRGVALQCRVTAEDPANEFRPDTGRIVGFRQPGGAGVRLDGGGGYVGAEITPYLRLAHREGHLPGPYLRSCGPPGRAGPGRVPRTGGVHQPLVSPGGPGPRRLPRRSGHHLLHRRTPRAHLVIQ